ncbi:MAG: ABC transporter ATP-binding protein [Clostridia bacterium]|nr:ABC transporter ATP-binding protein [Clostridia bacterium]
MKKLLRYMKGYRTQCILGPIFKALEAVFELCIPLVVKSIIDVGIGNADKAYIVKMCGLMVLLGVVGLSSTLVAQYFAARAACGFSARLRSALFSHTASLSYSELDSLGASTMITRMTSDVNQVQNGVNMFLRLFSRSPFIVFGSMIMAFTIDVDAALVFVAAIAILAVVVFTIMGITVPLHKKVQKHLEKTVLLTRENLAGVRVVRALSRENEEEEAYGSFNNAMTRALNKAGRVASLMNPLTYAIVNIALIALIYRGAISVNSGLISQGDVVALYNYMSQILIELIKLANLIVTVTKALACASRIESTLEIKSSIVYGNEKIDGSEVEFKNVSCKYKNGGENAVSGISFSAKSGEIIGIIGGTGSGKSTVVNMIPRFYDTSEGSVTIGGKDIKNISKEDLCEKIGVVPQKSVLFRGTIAENMRFGAPNATDKDIENALKTAQAYDFVAERGGVSSEVEAGGKNFSGGQKQRLCIARALVKKPSVLILDDSTSALDFATDANLRMAIRELSPCPTLFIVSQRAASVMHADKIAVLDRGELVGLGTHKELLETCEVYSEIYYSQFRKEKEAAK